ncbi:MAG: agmatinase [Candidatus Omnitrophica bacterium]|nr:agmatinase [Candidatus Omnitrophota bacterium]
MATGLKINCSDPYKANVVVLCAPYDRTASFRKGTVNGPAAIVESLKYQMETYDRYSQALPAAERKVALRELRNLNRCSPARMVARVKQEYEKYLPQGAFVLLLGGEHSVSTGAFGALATRYAPREVTIVQIDAHFDLRDDDSDYSDTPSGIYAHCTVMRRAHELGFNCVHVGTRAYAQEEMLYACKHGLAVFEWGQGPVPEPREIVEAISTRLVYVTIDIDGFDPACMPATGTPVPGGLEWYYAISLLKEIFGRKSVIGADVVEVAPRPFDVLTEYGAAQLCYTMLALREKRNT